MRPLRAKGPFWQCGCYRGQDTEGKGRQKGEFLEDRSKARWAENRFRKKGGQPQGTGVNGGALTWRVGRAAVAEWPE